MLGKCDTRRCTLFESTDVPFDQLEKVTKPLADLHAQCTAVEVNTMQHSRFGASRIAVVLACPGFNNAALELDLSVDDLSLDQASAELGRAAHEASDTA